MWCHLLKFSDPLRSRQGPFVDSGLIVLVTTAQSGHGPFCSLVVFSVRVFIFTQSRRVSR